MILGIDVGGTFTDATLLSDGQIVTAKTPTTPEDQSTGVMTAIDEVLRRAGVRADAVSRFGHGMTVGTNALLEERGARTALVCTRGFVDVIEIGRQDRAHLYRLQDRKPAPLIPTELRFPVEERCGPTGTIVPLERSEADRLADEVAAAEPEAVAVCLLFSYRDTEHEDRIAIALANRLPGIPISKSSAVLPRFREYERWSTTAIDAYLAPLLSRYLGALGERARAQNLPEPLLMRSSGGLMRLEDALGSGAWSVLSGPAGGAVGASLLAAASGEDDALGLDMGGTSCDVCVVAGGEVLRTETSEVSGRPIQLPMVDVHTVGAGGGSIAWRDPGGVMRVGPRSAGSVPGPACYGRGGTEPTVTDANLLLGRLPADSELAGGVRLDRDAAEGALERLGSKLGLDAESTALGVVRIANQEMVRAIRTVTVVRGLDPRDFALLPFGGAGPLHAAEIADELGVNRVICPRAGGTLSALGLCVARERHDTARTVMLDVGEVDDERIGSLVADLAESAAGREPRGDEEIEVVYSMRYRGQSFELEVPAAEVGADRDNMRRGFEERHRELYGHIDRDANVQLVTVRVAVKGPRPQVDLTAPAPGTSETSGADGAREGGGHAGSRKSASERPVRFANGWEPTATLGRAPDPGSRFAGPAVVELPGSTLLVPPGWTAEVDHAGTIALARAAADRTTPREDRATPHEDPQRPGRPA